MTADFMAKTTVSTALVLLQKFNFDKKKSRHGFHPNILIFLLLRSRDVCSNMVPHMRMFNV